MGRNCEELGAEANLAEKPYSGVSNIVSTFPFAENTQVIWPEHSHVMPGSGLDDHKVRHHALIFILGLMTLPATRAYTLAIGTIASHYSTHTENDPPNHNRPKAHRCEWCDGRACLEILGGKAIKNCAEKSENTSDHYDGAHDD